MAGLPWYRIWTNFPDHEKTLALCDAVRDDNAGMYVVRLHSHCAREALDGRVRAAAVEGIARWRKRRGALLDALTATGWVEPQEDGTVVVHGWEERNGSHIRKALSDAQKPRGNKPKARANPGAVPTPSRTRPDAVPLGTGEGPAVGDGRSETVDRNEETLSPAQARDDGRHELDPEAVGAVSPPTAEAVSGSGTNPHERAVETPREPETIAPATPGPQAASVDAAVTGTALPGAPPEASAPTSDPAPPPAGHSAEGGISPNRTPSPGQQAVGVDGSPTAAEPAVEAQHGAGSTSGVETAPAQPQGAGRRESGEGGPPAPPAAATTPASAMAALRAERERECPALAALLRAAEAERIVLTWPKEPRGMNGSAAILGPERALEALRRAHAKEPAPYGGYYALPLYQAAQLHLRRTSEFAPPALDDAWLAGLSPEARAAAEREWPEVAARVRHAAYPDAVPRLLEEARQHLVQRIEAGGAP